MYDMCYNAKVKKDLLAIIDSLSSLTLSADSDLASLLEATKAICAKCHRMPNYKLARSEEVTQLKEEFDSALKEVLAYTCTRSLKEITSERFYDNIL